MKIIKHIDITEEMVQTFGELTQDFNPIHFDEEYAKSTVFGKRIAHGMLISSFISEIIANDYPGKGSIYLSQNLKFIKPCYLNTTLKYVVELSEVNRSKYYLTTNIYNNLDELILEGSALILNPNKLSN